MPMHLKLRLCECHQAPVYRVRRPFWVRCLAPGRNLYHCTGCNQRLLVRWSRVVVDRPILS